jgi:hypothetical protein
MSSTSMYIYISYSIHNHHMILSSSNRCQCLATGSTSRQKILTINKKVKRTKNATHKTLSLQTNFLRTRVHFVSFVYTKFGQTFSGVRPRRWGMNLTQTGSEWMAKDTPGISSTEGVIRGLLTAWRLWRSVKLKCVILKPPNSWYKVKQHCSGKVHPITGYPGPRGGVEV